jgi:hypothetical protein
LLGRSRQPRIVRAILRFAAGYRGLVRCGRGQTSRRSRTLGANLSTCHQNLAVVLVTLRSRLDTANSGMIDVANMSLSFTPSLDTGNCGLAAKKKDADVMHQAICGAVSAGVTVVAGAGNDSKDSRTYAPAVPPREGSSQGLDRTRGVPPTSELEPSETARPVPGTECPRGSAAGRQGRRPRRTCSWRPPWSVRRFEEARAHSVSRTRRWAIDSLMSTNDFASEVGQLTAMSGTCARAASHVH